MTTTALSLKSSGMNPMCVCTMETPSIFVFSIIRLVFSTRFFASASSSRANPPISPQTEEMTRLWSLNIRQISTAFLFEISSTSISSPRLDNCIPASPISCAFASALLKSSLNDDKNAPTFNLPISSFSFFFVNRFSFSIPGQA